MKRTAIVVMGLVLVRVGIVSASEPAHSDLQSRIAVAVCRDLGLSVPCPEVDLKLQSVTGDFRMPEESLLHVSSVKASGGPNEFMARIECRPRNACVPFHVVLKPPAGAFAAVAGVEKGAASDKRFRPGRQDPAPVVRAGQRVRVGEETSGMRLSVSAVCLQAGGMGQKIRVRNAATGKVLLARVLSAQQLVVEKW